MLKLVFWLCIFFIFYGYLGYPLVIKLLAKIKPREIEKSVFGPTVSLLIPAYNEEGVIREKIQNSLELDYPKDKLEIIVASDGSSDNTCPIVKEFSGSGVMLLEYREHQGKFNLLNKSVLETKGQIVIFSDASGMLGRESVKELVGNFNDPRVGCVCGLYKMIPAEDSLAGKGYQKYLDYDIDIKKSESTFNTILGAHGAFYAIRRELFEPMPDYLINDDFYIPMKIVAKGYRAVYEDRAVVTDRIEYSVAKEFRRRVRIGFGNWQQIFEFRNLLSPYKGLLAWQFYSHKALRAVMPIVLIIAFTTSLLLEVATYKVFSWSFSLLLLLALVGWIIQGLRLRAGPLYIPFFLIMGNYAYLVGTIKFFFTNKKVEW